MRPPWRLNKVNLFKKFLKAKSYGCGIYYKEPDHCTVYSVHVPLLYIFCLGAGVSCTGEGGWRPLEQLSNKYW